MQACFFLSHKTAKLGVVWICFYLPEFCLPIPSQRASCWCISWPSPCQKMTPRNPQPALVSLHSAPSHPLMPFRTALYKDPGPCRRQPSLWEEFFQDCCSLEECLVHEYGYPSPLEPPKCFSSNCTYPTSLGHTLLLAFWMFPFSHFGFSPQKNYRATELGLSQCKWGLRHPDGWTNDDFN